MNDVQFKQHEIIGLSDFAVVIVFLVLSLSVVYVILLWLKKKGYFTTVVKPNGSDSVNVKTHRISRSLKITYVSLDDHDFIVFESPTGISSHCISGDQSAIFKPTDTNQPI